MPIGGLKHAYDRGPPWWRILTRKDVLAGLLFVGTAVLGLWVSRDYPIGTAFRMGTGYVPRLLCWILLLLGAIILVQGVRAAEGESEDVPLRRRPLVFVPLALVAFAFSVERLGLVLATVLLIGIGSLAGREMRPVETAVAGLALLAVSVAIFIWGLGLPIRVWPEG